MEQMGKDAQHSLPGHRVWPCSLPPPPFPPRLPTATPAPFLTSPAQTHSAHECLHQRWLLPEILLPDLCRCQSGPSKCHTSEAFWTFPSSDSPALCHSTLLSVHHSSSFFSQCLCFCAFVLFSPQTVSSWQSGTTQSFSAPHMGPPDHLAQGAYTVHGC